MKIISWHNICSMMLLSTLLATVGCEPNKDVAADDDFDLSKASAAINVAPTSAVIRLPSGGIDFVVEGGNPPYWWRIANNEIGSLTAYDNKAVYTPTEVGGNFIYATDSRGNSASAPIVTNP